MPPLWRAGVEALALFLEGDPLALDAFAPTPPRKTPDPAGQLGLPGVRP